MFRASIAALLLAGIPITAVQGGGKGGLALGALGVQLNTHGSALAGLVQPGFHGSPGYPFFGVWGGYGGYGGYGSPNNSMTGSNAYGQVTPYVPMQNIQAQQKIQAHNEAREFEMNMVALSNELPATLALDLPTSGVVWVNGEKGDKIPTNSWTLASPDLKHGQEYTFNITAQWDVDGNTFECKRTITVASGSKSRLTVLSGAQVK